MDGLDGWGLTTVIVLMALLFVYGVKKDEAKSKQIRDDFVLEFAVAYPTNEIEHENVSRKVVAKLVSYKTNCLALMAKLQEVKGHIKTMSRNNAEEISQYLATIQQIDVAQKEVNSACSRINNLVYLASKNGFINEADQIGYYHSK